MQVEVEEREKKELVINDKENENHNAFNDLTLEIANMKNEKYSQQIVPGASLFSGKNTIPGGPKRKLMKDTDCLTIDPYWLANQTRKGMSKPAEL